MSRHLVFLYGTLKRGQPNEYLINDIKDAKFIGKAVTCEKYPLVIGGPWRLPYLLKLDGKGKNVKGDVIEVDDKALERLDDFEEHPNWYERMLIDVQLIKVHDGETQNRDLGTLKCWVYFCKIYDEQEVDTTHYEDYDSFGDHGLEYDVSENKEHPRNKEKESGSNP